MKLFRNHKKQVPLLIGVCGRSCSGKGQIAETIASMNHRVLRINADIFFAATTPCCYRGYHCWEHTDCIRWNHLLETLTALKAGNAATIQYRAPWTSSYDIRVTSDDLQKRNIVLLEGHLLFTKKEVLQLFDTKIWIEVTDENMLYRRLTRDGNMSGIKYIHEVIIPVSKTYEDEQRGKAEKTFDGNPEGLGKREEITSKVTYFLNDVLRKNGSICYLDLPAKQQAWEVHFGDLIMDHASHPVDFQHLKDWVKQRVYQLENGQELVGSTFRYRKNPDNGNYELRLSSGYHMYRYTAEPT
jgi:uridine kinase